MKCTECKTVGYELAVSLLSRWSVYEVFEVKGSRIEVGGKNMKCTECRVVGRELAVSLLSRWSVYEVFEVKGSRT